MIGKDYFARQAMTLLRLARLTKDPAQSANLAAKAAELQERSAAAHLAAQTPASDDDSVASDKEARKPGG
jgi:hypothetical protein